MGTTFSKLIIVLSPFPEKESTVKWKKMLLLGAFYLFINLFVYVFIYFIYLFIYLFIYFFLFFCFSK